MKSILPKDDLFFDSFEKVGALNVEGAARLVELFEQLSSVETLAIRIKSIESESDEVVHRTYEHLHKTFVTPLDRQDIIKLIHKYDDVLDFTEAAASRVNLYKPRSVPPEAQRLASVLHKCAQTLEEMLKLIRNLKKTSQRVLSLSVEVDRLENEADQLHRAALGRLFGEEQDPFELIKWKDILQHIESAIDCCEDVSNIVEGIVLEYS